MSILAKRESNRILVPGSREYLRCAWQTESVSIQEFSVASVGDLLLVEINASARFVTISKVNRVGIAMGFSPVGTLLDHSVTHFQGHYSVPDWGEK